MPGGFLEAGETPDAGLRRELREELGVGLEGEDVEIITGELLDHNGMDWSRVKRTAYLLHQHVRYEYPAPIRDLRHRLVIVPPRVHGDQRRVLHRVDVSGALARTRARLDEFGNPDPAKPNWANTRYIDWTSFWAAKGIWSSPGADSKTISRAARRRGRGSRT